MGNRRSVKRGRAYEIQKFFGSIFAILFGIFWMFMAFQITSQAGEFGIIAVIFPLFGIVAVISGIVNAVISYKNAFGENRFSEYDIVDSDEEPDPLQKKFHKENLNDDMNISDDEEVNFCPYCGEKISSEFEFCPKCGKKLP